MTTGQTSPSVCVRNLWLASFMLAHGYALLRTTASPNGRVAFFFDNPRGDAREAIGAFYSDQFLQRLISGRIRVSDLIAATRDRCGVLEGAALAAILAPLTTTTITEARP